MSAAAERALGECRDMLGMVPFHERQRQGLCWSCRHSAANRQYDPATLERVGPPLRCRWEVENGKPHRAGSVPGVVRCGCYEYEPGAAG